MTTASDSLVKSLRGGGAAGRGMAAIRRCSSRALPPPTPRPAAPPPLRLDSSPPVPLRALLLLWRYRAISKVIYKMRLIHARWLVTSYLPCFYDLADKYKPLYLPHASKVLRLGRFPR